MDSEELKLAKIKWEENLKKIPLFKADIIKWPEYVRSISIDELSIVGVDKRGKLYWDGVPITLKRKIELNWFERILASLAAMGTFGVFILELLRVVKVISF